MIRDSFAPKPSLKKEIGKIVAALVLLALAVGMMVGIYLYVDPIMEMALQ